MPPSAETWVPGWLAPSQGANADPSAHAHTLRRPRSLMREKAGAGTHRISGSRCGPRIAGLCRPPGGLSTATSPTNFPSRGEVGRRFAGPVHKNSKVFRFASSRRGECAVAKSRRFKQLGPQESTPSLALWLRGPQRANWEAFFNGTTSDCFPAPTSTPGELWNTLK